MAVIQHAIAKTQVDQLFACLSNALPHHFGNGSVFIGNTKFRRPGRARLCERHIGDEPKSAPALPEHRVTGLANYEINRACARRKCAVAPPGTLFRGSGTVVRVRPKAALGESTQTKSRRLATPWRSLRNEKAAPKGGF